MAGEMLELRLQMAIRPDWRNADILRLAVLTCVKAVSVEGGGDEESMLGVVTSELVENAIKYGNWDDAKSSLEVRVASDGHAIEISVANPTDPESTHFHELEKTLAWIRTFPTPRDAYLARMKKVLEHESEGASRLGLVRVVNDGPCELAAELSADRRKLTVIAKAKV